MPTLDNLTSDVTSFLSGLASTTITTASRLANTIDTQADNLASHLRHHISHTPLRPHPPPTFTTSSTTTFTRYRWPIILTTSLLTSLTTYRFLSPRHRHKPRAPRAPNGARKEVLLLSGPIHDLLTQTLALDLEKRGFIVFLIAHSIDDEHAIVNLGGKHLRPLHIDLHDPEAASIAVDNFLNFLTTPPPFTGGSGSSGMLRLAGMILLAASTTVDSHHRRPAFPVSPIESIPPPTLSDSLHTHLLTPILTTTLFTRVLRLFPSSRVVVLTPSRISALTPPFHAPEATAAAGIAAFARVLKRELAPTGVKVVEVRVGEIEFPVPADPVREGRRTHASTVNAARAEVMAWGGEERRVYAKRYVAMETRERRRGVRVRRVVDCVVGAVLGGEGRVRVGWGAWWWEGVAGLGDRGVEWVLGGSGGEGRDVREGLGTRMETGGRRLEWEGGKERG
ncbi:DUF1776-domain-containing protein [Ascodesmis nigricans]|uniref:DUF1776-domain-containing protein n=1 Tax=Ascodesmis nigricans TaxID=341454 RepID=A0A4S2MZF5_9PEZI|nr:DUF1776-domain-containing protein [Ascodesmis nigricans]